MKQIIGCCLICIGAYLLASTMSLQEAIAVLFIANGIIISSLTLK